MTPSRTYSKINFIGVWFKYRKLAGIQTTSNKRTNPYVINFSRISELCKLYRILQSKIVSLAPDYSFDYICCPMKQTTLTLATAKAELTRALCAGSPAMQYWAEEILTFRPEGKDLGEWVHAHIERVQKHAHILVLIRDCTSQNELITALNSIEPFPRKYVGEIRAYASRVDDNTVDYIESDEAEAALKKRFPVQYPEPYFRTYDVEAALRRLYPIKINRWGLL